MTFLKSILALVAFFAPMAALAAEEGAVAASSGIGSWGAAIAISIAALGGALGQAKTAASALDGIARNPAAQPKIFVPMIIGLALIESLVLYAFVIALIKY